MIAYMRVMNNVTLSGFYIWERINKCYNNIIPSGFEKMNFEAIQG